MKWRHDPSFQTSVTGNHPLLEAGGLLGSRRVFDLRKEQTPPLLGMLAVDCGKEIRLTCCPEFGPVEFLFGDHVIDAQRKSLGCWVELRARYAADLAKAEIRLDRALAPFALDVPTAHELGRVNVSRGFCLACGRPMDWRNTATHFCQGCLVSDADRRDGTNPRVPP